MPRKKEERATMGDSEKVGRVRELVPIAEYAYSERIAREAK